MIRGRFALFGLLPLVVACDGQEQIANMVEARSPDSRPCVMTMGAGTAPDQPCTAEKTGDILTIRHADGGFRRFRVLTDGRGLESADGAEPATVRLVDHGHIEVDAGDTRYRLPAKIAGRP